MSVHTHTHTHTHSHTYSLSHTHTHTHSHMYSHTYTQLFYYVLLECCFHLASLLQKLEAVLTAYHKHSQLATPMPSLTLPSWSISLLFSLQTSVSSQILLEWPDSTIILLYITTLPLIIIAIVIFRLLHKTLIVILISYTVLWETQGCAVTVWCNKSRNLIIEDCGHTQRLHWSVRQYYWFTVWPAYIIIIWLYSYKCLLTNFP